MRQALIIVAGSIAAFLGWLLSQHWQVSGVVVPTFILGVVTGLLLAGVAREDQPSIGVVDMTDGRHSLPLYLRQRQG